MREVALGAIGVELSGHHRAYPARTAGTDGSEGSEVLACALGVAVSLGVELGSRRALMSRGPVLPAATHQHHDAGGYQYGDEHQADGKGHGAPSAAVGAPVSHVVVPTNASERSRLTLALAMVVSGLN